MVQDNIKILNFLLGFLWVEEMVWTFELHGKRGVVYTYKATYTMYTVIKSFSDL